ncbi:MAG: hypothetical protein ACR2PM_14325 [Hyphomicrobiales bacterium]
MDHAIAETIDPAAGGNPVRDYTSSVDTCLSLIGAALPDWHWHVGHGPSGILPYASLTRTTGPDDAATLRVEATAGTVPLALLHATVKALIADQGQHG